MLIVESYDQLLFMIQKYESVMKLLYYFPQEWQIENEGTL